MTHLTRRVFRRILSNETYFVPRCGVSSRRAWHPRSCLEQPQPVQRRTIFGLGKGEARELKEIDITPGLEKMAEYGQMVKMGTRAPPLAELVKAFRTFFDRKSKVHESVLSLQAMHVLRSFEYMKDNDMVLRDEKGLGMLDLEKAIVCLSRPVAGPSREYHNQLAKMIMQCVRGSEEDLVSTKMLPKYVQVLCTTGDAGEARQLLDELWEGLPDDQRQKLSVTVLQGLSQEKNDQGLIDMWEVMQTRDIPFDPKIHQIMTLHFAQQDNIEQTKKWYRHSIAEEGAPLYSTNHAVLKMCLRTNEYDLGDSMFHSVLEGNPSKSSWDTILQWAAARGKGVEEVERMMHVMVERNEQRTSVRPDIETINRLIELFNSREDSFLAERYVALAERWRLIPNAKTYLLQMEHRMRAGDLSGSLAAYQKLRTVEISENEDLPQVNGLIRALCIVAEPDAATISSLVTDVTEREVRFEPATVSALCLHYLQRRETLDAHDLLSTNIYHYTKDERATIVAMLMAFVQEPKNSTARVWDAYNMLVDHFPELSIAQRTVLMQDFFRRRRADMACLIFGHMRQAPKHEYRPKLDTYIACFEGIASLGDREGLDMVHNMMKLDTTIEPTTKLLNVLMLANAACEMPTRSLEYWKDIINSREGPSYDSIQIALYTCETYLFGESHARAIWKLLEDVGVEMTKEIYEGYAAALASTSASPRPGSSAEVEEQHMKHKYACIDEAKAMVDDMKSVVGVEPDHMTIGAVYNAIGLQRDRDAFAGWASETYPQIWTHLETSVGYRRRLQSREKRFRIERVFKP